MRNSSKDLIAGSPLRRCRHILDEAIVGKFLLETESARGDALSDFHELLARALEIRFGGGALQRWTVADAVEHLNQIAHAANLGQIVTSPGRNDLEAMLRVCKTLRDSLKRVLVANFQSWERGSPSPSPESLKSDQNRTLRLPLKASILC